MQKKILILIPIFNDWESLIPLLGEMNTLLAGNENFAFEVLLVNDGSTVPGPSLSEGPIKIHRLDLPANVGHQKAIAVGLAFIHHHHRVNGVVIMDGDGEDRPIDLIRLIEKSGDSGNIVFASRINRSEGPLFKVFYFLYKRLFRLLTGRKISFGHFMFIPVVALQKLVYNSEITNHLAAAILKSGASWASIPVKRGKRYRGQSQMGFNALVLHGLGAIAVFIDKVATRLLVFSLAMIGITMVGILTILSIKWFTDSAIPGWASTILSSLTIVLLQSFLLSLFTVFLYLGAGSQRKFIPAIHYTDLLGDFKPKP